MTTTTCDHDMNDGSPCLDDGEPAVFRGFGGEAGEEMVKAGEDADAETLLAALLDASP